MKKKLVGARLSLDVVAAIRAQAKAEGVTLTQVIEDCLRRQLGLSDGDSDDEPNLVERLAEVEQRLSQIEAKGQGQATRTRYKGRR